MTTHTRLVLALTIVPVLGAPAMLGSGSQTPFVVLAQPTEPSPSRLADVVRQLELAERRAAELEARVAELEEDLAEVGVRLTGALRALGGQVGAPGTSDILRDRRSRRWAPAAPLPAESP